MADISQKATYNYCDNAYSYYEHRITCMTMTRQNVTIVQVFSHTIAFIMTDLCQIILRTLYDLVFVTYYRFI